METSLHRALKLRYAQQGSRTEAVVRGYRADVLLDDLVVEIQASPLGAIVSKVAELVQHMRVLVVKPVTGRKYLVRRTKPGGAVLSRRLSPKRGKLLDTFDDLVRFTRAFPHPNLILDVVMVEEEEHRVMSRRSSRANFRVQDRKLLAVTATYRLRTGADLLRLLPEDPPAVFTSESLASFLGTPVWFARVVAYTLRHCGAAQVTGKSGNRLVYGLLSQPPPLREVATAC